MIATETVLLIIFQKKYVRSVTFLSLRSGVMFAGSLSTTRGALVREYYGKEIIKEFKKTAREKGLWL